MVDINVAATPRKTIPVTLVGKRYQITPPKAALAMKLGVQAKLAGENPQLVMDAMDEWLEKAFGKQAAAVRKRLDDPDDLLDVPHLMVLMEKVMEATTDGDPTGSPSGSVRSRPRTGKTSTAGRSRKG